MFHACCVCDTRDPEEFQQQIDIELPLQRYPSRQQEERQLSTKQSEEVTEELLVDMVQNFVRLAISGSTCQILDSTTGKRCEASFHLSQNLKLITIESEKCNIPIDLQSCQDAYAWSDIARVPKLLNFSKLPGIRELSPKEKAGFVLIEYVDQRQYLQKICILLANNLLDLSIPDTEYTAGDIFVRSFRILHMNCQAQYLDDDVSSSSF